MPPNELANRTNVVASSRSDERRFHRFMCRHLLVAPRCAKTCGHHAPNLIMDGYRGQAIPRMEHHEDTRLAQILLGERCSSETVFFAQQCIMGRCTAPVPIG